MPDYVRENWLHDEREKFLSAIANDFENKTEYALVNHTLLTDKVLEQLAIAKEEIQ